MGKKVKKDEKPPPEDVFDTLLVESHQAGTVVLMLDSPEEDVLSKACEAIYKFVDKCDENKKTLLDLDAVGRLLNLIQHEDRIVRRNACMAFGVMTAHAEVRKLLRKKEETIPAIVALLQPEEDTVVHEFAALCLSNMSQEFSSKTVIFENDALEPLINCLTSHDPDVQKNAIETIALMLQDYQTRAAIRDLGGLMPLVELLRSEYAIIQELSLVALARATQDADNRCALRELDVLGKFIDFIGNPEYNDLHVHSLQVLSNCLEDPECMEMIRDNGGLVKLIAFITDTTPPEEEKDKKDKKGASRAGKKKKGDDDDVSSVNEMPVPTYHGREKGGEPSHTLPVVKQYAARAIARAAKNGENRKILHEQEAEKMLITLLGHDDPQVQVACAQALAVMSDHILSKDSIGQWDGIEPLIKMLRSDNPDVKEAAALALANLTTANAHNSHKVSSQGGIEHLINILGDTCEAAIANAACTLTNMATDEAYRADIVNTGVVAALIEPLKSDNTAVQSKTALAVAAFVNDAETRTQFRDAGGLEPLLNLLMSGDDEVRRSAAWGVTVIAVDEPTATEIMKLGGLESLQEVQQSGTRHNRFVDAAFSRLLDSNLSAKYALTGYLGPANVIQDGFYDVGQLKPGSVFMSLEDYSHSEPDAKRPVLLVNAKFEKPQTPAEQASDTLEVVDKSSKVSLTAKGSKKDSRVPKTPDAKSRSQREQRKKEVEVAQEKKEEEEEEKEEVYVVPSDSQFCKYVEEIMEKIHPLTSTREQILALSLFVAEKMGGVIDRGQVSNFSYELPISQLKFDLKSNVIPIGMIKTGIHYHRALLFKALADRLAIPCSLTRGEYNRAWNIVMLCDDTQTPPAPSYPPNEFLVDLIHVPGRLMRTDSADAVNYQKL